MTRRNNVDLGALEEANSAMRRDMAKAKRTNRIEGVWHLNEGQPQFSADISFEGGKITLEADQPKFLGGAATRPGPMQYALFGSVSCFTATFVTVATQEGLKLDEVRSTIEADVDFSKTFDLADSPVVEEVRINLAVKSPASPDQLDRVLKLAEERCPASWCLRNPIRLVPKLEHEAR